MRYKAINAEFKMRDSQIRDVTFLDVIGKAEPVYAPCHSMSYFIQKISKLYAAGQTDRWNKNKTQKLYIRDLEIDENNQHALMLLYYNNGNASAASYSHLDTNHQRIEPPLDREGRPESAHLLINLNPTNISQIRHLALLEDASKINRQMVESYLNFLFRVIKKVAPADFQADDPDGSRGADGQPRKYKFANKFELQGHPSQEFLTMLESGKLTGIALETHSRERLIVGDGSFVSPVKSEIRLKPTLGKWHENARQRLSEAINFGKQGSYESARVTFIAEDNKSHTVRLDTATENVVGDSFILKKRLSDFSNLLPEADTAISTETKTKMLAIFR